MNTNNPPAPKYKIGDSICLKNSNHHLMEEVKAAVLSAGGAQWEYWVDGHTFTGWVIETDIIDYLAERDTTFCPNTVEKMDDVNKAYEVTPLTR